MPAFKKPTIKKVYLPSTKDEPNEEDRFWIKIRDRIELGDTEPLFIAPNEFEKRMSLLESFIIDWNATDEAGGALSIERENIRHLVPTDSLYIVNMLLDMINGSKSKGLETEEKKTSTATLTPPTTIETQQVLQS